ncbi:MAG: flagellar motor protein MotA [Sulfurimonas sp.]|nr:MAG: flagellar motor protein MotA [Sulfurimonas sp.]
MKKIIILISLLVFSLYSSELDTLLLKINKDTKTQLKLDKQREFEFLKNLQKAKKLLGDTKKKLKLAKQKTIELKKEFKKQKTIVNDYNKRLDKSTGSLKNLFAISQQEAKNFSSLIKTSMTSSHLKERDVFLDSFASSRSVPSIKELEKLWHLYLEEIIEAGKIKTYETNVINTHGAQKRETVTRVGLFSAFNKDEFIRYDDSLQEFVKIMRQPNSSSQSYIADYYTTSDEITPMLIDPTRGVLFHMLKEKATILDRIHQGGVIGYIILLLGVLTLLYAAYKYLDLWNSNNKINKQIKSSEMDISNPLGRILASFEKYKDKDINTIESKMDTAILKELPSIQAGLPMIKLVAAVAPLLGLLGTVTGMIETFQSITLFGTGDPKLMAGGISQALMTTVLGLVVAIPILFIYNVVFSKSKKIIEILTQQSSVLVAKQLEMLSDTPDEYSKNV